MEEFSEQYEAKCIKRLKEWGAPLEDWYCVQTYDVADEDTAPEDVELTVCELCDCASVRYVHVMRHSFYFEDVKVGCICAGIMDGDILAAKSRDRKMKNRAKRRSNFIKHEWHMDWQLSWSRVYRHQKLMIYEVREGIYSAACGSQSTDSYNRKPIRTFLSAMYAAFDLADPIEDCYHA